MKTMKYIVSGLMLALCAVATVAVGYGSPPVALAALGAELSATSLLPFVLAGITLDVFKADAFSVQSLTDAINKIPFVPGRAGQIVGFVEGGVITTSILLEERNGVITIVNPTPRGAPGTTKAKQKRTARTLTIPHYELNDGIYADEVQGIRAFGTESELETVQNKVNGRLAEFTTDLDVTLEYQRVGAVQGIILNGDGTTLYNLFTEFGVLQDAEVAFDLANASPANGALRKKCASVVRAIASNLDGVPFTGVHAFCGDTFFDELLAHKEVTDSYKNTSMAQVLREGYVLPNGNKVYSVFEFGGIVWENYRGTNGASAMVNADKCHIFPTGVQGLFRTVYAPADYIETVNTMGRPRYAKQVEMRNGKGIDLEVQMNGLSYCTRPKSLIKGKRQA